LKASKARFHFRIAAFSNYKENRQPDPSQHASSLFLNVFGTVFTLKADSTPFPPQAELLALARLSQFAGVFGYFRFEIAAKVNDCSEAISKKAAVKTYPLAKA